MSEENPNPPLKRGEIQMFESAIPDLQAGKYTAKIEQVVESITDTKLITLADEFEFEVVGPRYRLSPRDVLGVFPAAGAKEASNLRIPHIALRRRTLPWERRVPKGVDDDPWMMLLLLEVPEQDYDPNADKPSLALEFGSQLVRNHNFPGGRGDVLKISGTALRRIAPKRSERRLLTHVRRVSLQDTEGEFAGDDDGYVSMVLGNRLPRVGLNYVAALVSIEFAGKENTASANGATNNDWVLGTTYELPVLHYWKYKTADLGGDFQAWAQALHYNGGVHLLGQIPNEDQAAAGPETDGLGGVSLDHRERDGQPERGHYHGPALAVPMHRSDEIIVNADAARAIVGGKYDVSYAAAFELGRLLAMSDRGILQALIAFRRSQFTFERESLFLPQALPVKDFLEQMPHKLEELLAKINGDWVMQRILSKQDILINPVRDMISLEHGFHHDPSGLMHELAGLEGMGFDRFEALGLEGLHESMHIPGLPGHANHEGLGGLGGLDFEHQLEFENMVDIVGGNFLDANVHVIEGAMGSLVMANDMAMLDKP